MFHFCSSKYWTEAGLKRPEETWSEWSEPEAAWSEALASLFNPILKRLHSESLYPRKLLLDLLVLLGLHLLEATWSELETFEAGLKRSWSKPLQPNSEAESLASRVMCLWFNVSKRFCIFKVWFKSPAAVAIIINDMIQLHKISVLEPWVVCVFWNNE